MMNLKRALLLAMLPGSVLAAPPFTLHSSDFNDGGLLEARFAGNKAGNPACSGENVSPALSWSNVPAGTQSFALLMTDPVGAKGLGVTHMVAYNIAATRSHFAQGELTQGAGYTGGKNSPGTTHYYGPCPPLGSGMHHYNFVLIATDLPVNQLPAGLTHDDLIARLKGHALAGATIVGRFTNDK
ncbi:YbhB/YbcL family Raf kinase inhibitor-like protein [Pantoea sp. Mb-10]|uniref:YbhB/YbcL family Raf kinase inhibitor-like protein n=1 Tax=unclassified Pantoea TaxID=2630326 RepID=UPI001E5C658D|nr:MULTISPECIES: YbhB/YbcL family Raf kinase inhibitor-like protein [unclassified Pantoea]MCE0492112.1 YbhB/YbcL family Raf kinase inhibitor-like protein [Pantoea sp. Mb-10]MCE0502460.1 YbhB/YbcL family Raf kinase inhibitor-like protein [Pantoea sp. Pb-8]